MKKLNNRDLVMDAHLEAGKLCTEIDRIFDPESDLDSSMNKQSAQHHLHFMEVNLNKFKNTLNETLKDHKVCDLDDDSPLYNAINELKKFLTSDYDLKKELAAICAEVLFLATSFDLDLCDVATELDEELGQD